MKTKFSLLMFFMFLVRALLFTQVVPFLQARNFNSQEVAYILASYSFFSLLIQILMGRLSDRIGKIKKLLFIWSLLLVPSAYLAYAYPAISFVYYLLVFTVMVGASKVTSGLLESWILDKPEVHHNFSYIRSYGSFSWAIGALLSGFILQKYEGLGLARLSLLFSIPSFYYLIRIPDIQPSSYEEKENQVSLKELFSIKSFNLLLLTLFFIYLVYTADTITVTQHLFELGGDERSLGIKWFLQAISEIPMMFLASNIIRRIGAKRTLRISVIILAIRYILLALSTEVWQVLLLSLMQAFIFPLLLVSQRYLIYDIIPKHLMASAQMSSSAISDGLSSIVSPLISGFFLSFTSTSISIFLFASLLIIPLILMKRNEFT